MGAPLPRGWTSKKIKRWLALRGAGKSNQEIAEALEVSLKAVNKLVTRMRKLGHDIPDVIAKRTLLTDAERDLIHELAAGGMGPSAIAARIRSDLKIERSVSGICNSASYRVGRIAVKQRREEALRSPAAPVAIDPAYRIVAGRAIPTMKWKADCEGNPLPKPVTLPRISIMSERAA